MMRVPPVRKEVVAIPNLIQVCGVRQLQADLPRLPVNVIEQDLKGWAADFQAWKGKLMWVLVPENLGCSLSAMKKAVRTALGVTPCPASHA